MSWYPPRSPCLPRQPNPSPPQHILIGHIISCSLGFMLGFQLIAPHILPVLPLLALQAGVRDSRSPCEFLRREGFRMASSTLHMRCHAVLRGLDNGRNCRGHSELQSSVSFRGREISFGIRHGVTTGKHHKVGARAALMQAAPIPMRSHETKRRYFNLSFSSSIIDHTPF